jgi:Holliday junction resolvase RusA-like endonuclease
VSEVLVAVWVPGVPRTKGSLDARMQDTPQSKRWRQLVAAEIERDMRVRYADGRPLPVGLRYQGPVAVRCVFVRADGIGDVDKLARNVLDALTDSRVIADDVQVVELRCTRVEPAGTRRGEGALVVVAPWDPIDREESATREIDSWVSR